MTTRWETLWHNACLATMTPNGNAYGLIENGVVAADQGRIVWIGSRQQLDPRLATLADEVIDCRGRLITPGLIDCHTHLVYGGNRAQEFEQRLQGKSYADIAKAGGGILATVRATREADPETLYQQSKQRLQNLSAEGVTCVEIKSGYGLDTLTECKMLRVARRLGEQLPITAKTTFLGAHALPPDYAGRADDYIEQVCKAMLPNVAEQNLADAVDAFCEHIAFSTNQVERVFQAATALNLPVKLHAEQLSNQGGSALAARYHALSADHLEYLDSAGVRAMAAAGTVAVLLPGAFYFLGETQLPPIAALRQQGVPIAVATDSNPGSSPVTSLLLMLNMACTLFRLTPEEALAGVTRHAARALGVDNERGTLETGKQADLVAWDITHPAELAYRIGANPCAWVVRQGALSRGRY